MIHSPTLTLGPDDQNTIHSMLQSKKKAGFSSITAWLESQSHSSNDLSQLIEGIQAKLECKIAFLQESTHASCFFIENVIESEKQQCMKLAERSQILTNGFKFDTKEKKKSTKDSPLSRMSKKLWKSQEEAIRNKENTIGTLEKLKKNFLSKEKEMNMGVIDRLHELNETKEKMKELAKETQEQETKFHKIGKALDQAKKPSGKSTPKDTHNRFIRLYQTIQRKNELLSLWVKEIEQIWEFLRKNEPQRIKLVQETLASVLELGKSPEFTQIIHEMRQPVPGDALKSLSVQSVLSSSELEGLNEDEMVEGAQIAFPFSIREIIERKLGKIKGNEHMPFMKGVWKAKFLQHRTFKTVGIPALIYVTLDGFIVAYEAKEESVGGDQPIGKALMKVVASSTKRNLVKGEKGKESCIEFKYINKGFIYDSEETYKFSFSFGDEVSFLLECLEAMEVSGL